MLSIKDLSLHDSEPQIPKATEKILLSYDRISDLPDDILLRIISFLTLKEAGSTSVLSKRWRHLWAYVPHLNFDAPEILHEIRKELIAGRQTLIKEEPKYFRWVDQVVTSHRSHTIDEFRVRFNLKKDQNIRSKHYDNWLRFAMEKRVKKLVFNTGPLLVGHPVEDRNAYTFPSLSPWIQLTSLELCYVCVTDEVLHNFLSGCPNLERLSVSRAYSLVDLKVVGPPKLKYLKLWFCYEIEHLEISAPNLTEVHVNSSLGLDLLCNVLDLSSFMPQLEVFYVGNVVGVGIEGRFQKVYPVAPRLKMLFIHLLNFANAEELFELINVIKACPVLHKLELQLCEEEKNMTEKAAEAEVFPHKMLKILEISEFNGCCEAVSGFVSYLFKTFVSVEKVTFKIDNYMIIGTEDCAKAKEEAERLAAFVKPGTEVEIICESEKLYCESVF